ncbi:hypothetical protein EVAR_59999_1 [Eumeta japonica]|uniref:Uncharacterized protein n=1 Tax=Eumeta variegata TaxID=151549 RepID=A0A4C1ZAQ9_EUMVA|nr:hypothetical protein EVAR_59999_1 [Eumeta japonica]
MRYTNRGIVHYLIYLRTSSLLLITYLLAEEEYKSKQEPITAQRALLSSDRGPQLATPDIEPRCLCTQTNRPIVTRCHAPDVAAGRRSCLNRNN